MMSFKIPSFISEYFKQLPHEQKKEAIERYKSWYKHDFTQLLIEHLEDTRDKLVREDEDKNDFLSKFQFTSTSISNKAKRKFIKELTKKMNWEL